MRIAVFSTKPYDEKFLREVNERGDRGRHELVFFEPRLNRQTARLADGFPAVCPFVHDELDAETLGRLAEGGTRLVALRCAGFNNVDLAAAGRLGIVVARVPAYSPHAVAEHTVALILALARKLHKAYNRVREGNFALEGLLGCELVHRTAGVVGTGKIGSVVVQILSGFGCRMLAHDVHRNAEVERLGARYVELDELFRESDVVTLHCPLVPETHHMIDADALGRMKDGVMLINTSRGKLIDTGAVVEALKSGRIGALGLDVYEEEDALFYEDLSAAVIQDDVFARMLTFPNVIITAHQAFFTWPAMWAIAEQTLGNVTAMEEGRTPPGVVGAEHGRFA
jgi:D-lactate dehydrogenase